MAQMKMKSAQVQQLIERMKKMMKQSQSQKQKAAAKNKLKSAKSTTQMAKASIKNPTSRTNVLLSKIKTAKSGGKITKKKTLKGGQKKLDVAKPFGKITGADFKALKKKRGK